MFGGLLLEVSFGGQCWQAWFCKQNLEVHVWRPFLASEFVEVNVWRLLFVVWSGLDGY